METEKDELLIEFWSVRLENRANHAGRDVMSWQPVRRKGMMAACEGRDLYQGLPILSNTEFLWSNDTDSKSKSSCHTENGSYSQL
jgi:hypothetical protein